MHPNAMETLLPMQTNALDREAHPNGKSSFKGYPRGGARGLGLPDNPR